MAELNFDKVLASLRLRLDEVVSENEFDEITKEYLGKDSLLSDERKKLSTLSKEDKKSYGETLNAVNKSITVPIAPFAISQAIFIYLLNLSLE